MAERKTLKTADRACAGKKQASVYQPVEQQDLDWFGTRFPAERVLSGDQINVDYSHDELDSVAHFPELLVRPVNTDEVAAVMAYASSRRIPVVVRGSGTGLVGGCVAVRGGILLETTQMNKILELDRDNLTVTVEAGVLLMDLAQFVEAEGFFYPPDPGEKTATIAGNISTNAGGMRAVRYGVTRDYILGMEVVSADGEVLNLGGKNVKNSSGYSLLDLLIGSEGTLAFLTKLTVRLVPEPRVNLSLLIPFDDLDKCIEAVPAILGCGAEPTAVEFMEREVIKAAETYLGKQFPDASADAYLLIRLDGESVNALRPAMDALTELALSLGAKDVLLADTEERKESIWNARGAFLEAIKGGTPSMDECDVVLPRDRIAEFVRKSIEIGREEDVRICSFGHAGDGNLHIYACQDALPDDIWKPKVEAVMQKLYAHARAFGGEVSGEHGIGHAKRAFLAESVGERQIGLMRGIKAVFDPNGILNPGKVI